MKNTITPLETDMFREMVELLGRGYVPDYYASNAAPFVGVAKHHIAQATRPLKNEIRRLKRKLKAAEVTVTTSQKLVRPIPDSTAFCTECGHSAFVHNKRHGCERCPCKVTEVK